MKTPLLHENHSDDWGSFIDDASEVDDGWGTLEPEQIGAVALRPELSERDKLIKMHRNMMGSLTTDQQLKLDHAFNALDPNYAVPAEIKERKDQAAESLGRPLSWAEWLSSPTSPGQIRAENEDVEKIIDWSVQRQEAMQNDPAVQERLATMEARFATGLEGAVAAGKLHPSVLDNFKNQPKPKLRIASMLEDMQYMGMAYANKFENGESEITLSRDGNIPQHIINHEYMHTLVAFDDDEELGDVTWNEAGADEMAAAVDEYTPDFNPATESATHNLDYKDVFYAALKIGDMSLYDISEAGAKARANSEAADFLDKIGRRADLDMKGIFTHYKALYERRARERGEELDTSDIAYNMATRFGKIAKARASEAQN